MNLKTNVMTTALVMILAGGSQAVMASGSYGGGVSAGNSNAYQAGKSVFHKKLACDKCLLAGEKKLSKDQAQKLVDALSGSKQYDELLNSEDKESVSAYLKRRYKLQ